MDVTGTSEYGYWAFISYSSQDKSWADWLHRAIESYGIPARLVHHLTPTGEGTPKRLRPVFRDRAELSASADLGHEIEDALRASRFLIVICSPRAARSQWVNKEIETFQRFGRSSRILAVIVDGEPHAGGERECFPAALLQAEPIAADARKEGDGKGNARLKVLAGMLGIGFDALKQREAHRRIRRLQAGIALLSAIVLVVTSLAFYAEDQRVKAVKARMQAPASQVTVRPKYVLPGPNVPTSTIPIAPFGVSPNAVSPSAARCTRASQRAPWPGRPDGGTLFAMTMEGRAEFPVTSRERPRGSPNERVMRARIRWTAGRGSRPGSSGGDDQVQPLPSHNVGRASGFIDLHQDMLSGVARFDGGFPDYGANYLNGTSRATAIWSSLYPDDPSASLMVQLDAHDELLRANATSLRLMTTAADVDAEDHRTGVLPHSEGFNLPGIESHDLDWLWTERSLRSLSLTWNYETDYGFSCYEEMAAPLKPAGRRLVRAMQHNPLMLDLAHLNEGGFYQALDLYAPPVLVSHSFCRSIGDHPRGLTDAQLRSLGEHGGLVGLAFVPDFLGQGSIDEALRHIDRIVSLTGEGAISIGSDWGVTDMGELGDPSSLAVLLGAVAVRYGQGLAEKLAYANASAFLRAQLPPAV